MKEHLRNILFLLAAFFILLHNSIPHQHQAKISTVLSYECQGNHDSVFGFLKMVLHQNTGTEHLEHVTKSDFDVFTLANIQMDWQAFPVNFDLELLEEKTEHSSHNTFNYQDYFPHEKHANAFSLRGPPALA